MKNPIIDNRIVSSMTFAPRLRSFVEAVDVCDAMSEEEKEYILSVADSLIEYQRRTATEREEVEYLKRINIL